MRTFHLLESELPVVLEKGRIFFMTTELYYKNGQFTLLNGEQVNIELHPDDYFIKLGGRITCGK